MLDSLPRPPADRPSRLPRGRRLALGALLLLLAGATAVLAARGSPGPTEAAASPPRAPSPTAAAPSTAATVHAFDRVVGDSSGCQTLAAIEPQLLCALPGGVVTYMQVTDVQGAYSRHVVDVPRDPAAAGACATGLPEEGAWSRPASPDLTAGRFACRVDATEAEMWWTVDDAGVLAHAVRRDGDLATLFAWWRAHDEHP
jgi:hypothetical protein